MARALFWSLLCAAARASSNVVELSDAGYEAFTRSARRAVVLLYAGGNAEHGAALTLFADLATGAVDAEVVWGRLDVDANPATPAALGLAGAPDLAAYEEGEWVGYPEEFAAEALAGFLARVYGDGFEPRVIETAAQLAEAEAEFPVALFYGVAARHDLGWATPLVRLLARKHGLPAFLALDGANPAHKYSLRLKRDFHEGDLFYGGERPFLPGFVRQLVDTNARRRCPLFTPEAYKEVFGRRQPMVLLFDAETASPFLAEAEETLRRAAVRLQCRVLALHSEHWHTFATLFAVSRYALPFIGIVTFAEEKMVKYAVVKPSVEDAERFFYDYIMNTLQPFYKSEPVPAWQDARVMKVVRENFAEAVLESDKHVFLCAYTRFCRECSVMFQDMKDLAAALGAKYPAVQFALIDVQFNDIERVGVPDVPSFFLYKLGEKELPLVFPKPFTTERVDAFLAESVPPAEPPATAEL